MVFSSRTMGIRLEAVSEVVVEWKEQANKRADGWSFSNPKEWWNTTIDNSISTGIWSHNLYYNKPLFPPLTKNWIENPLYARPGLYQLNRLSPRLNFQNVFCSNMHWENANCTRAAQSMITQDWWSSIIGRRLPVHDAPVISHFCHIWCHWRIWDVCSRQNRKVLIVKVVLFAYLFFLIWNAFKNYLGQYVNTG